MKHILLVLTGLLTFISPLCSTAETLEIPLALSTFNSPWDVESADFEVDIPLAAITEISLHLEGMYQDQFYMCGAPYYTNYASARIELRIGDEVNGASYDSLLHAFPQTDTWQPFDFIKVLLNAETDDLAFLDDGAGQIGLIVNARDVDYVMGNPCYPGTVPITLSAASLVVTYDPALPTAVSTWGALKQMYR